MKVDLHVHSHYSDGSNAVSEVMKQAKKNGVTHLSFVDHDTVDGWLDIQRQANHFDINVIPGIEISAYDFKRERKVHILGYNYKQEANHIRNICNPLLHRRNDHSLWQIRKINELGYQIDEQVIKQKALPSNTIYKQHIMDELTKAPYDSMEYRNLYQQIFKHNGVAAGDIVYIDAFDAVEAIVKDGGIAVVAHPGQLESYDLIPELVEVGLGGLERNHPDHTVRDHDKVETLAEELNLLMTGGTDYHGGFGIPIQIGEITSPINKLLV
ncbi:PHP domain-containing protein [Oceanobacillus kimchii]|uniref:Phosphatase n=1 Tax=Oceanobacillus kimchii TaxID=746691 RepID=A0ABQ5TGY8_9BACI|nr:PHP domain-containing protein [Oceanobacillus kimchii]GLO65417.1 phosphatase [Oceanobacillus kimchii]